MLNLKSLQLQLSQLEAQFNQEKLIAIQYLLHKGLNKFKLSNANISLVPKKKPVFLHNAELANLVDQIEARRVKIEKLHAKELRSMQVKINKINKQIDQLYKADPELTLLEQTLKQKLALFKKDLLNYYSLKIK